MNGTVISIITGYAVLAALLLVACLHTRIAAWVKSLAIVVVGAFYFYTYDALVAAFGWPTDAAVPARFQLLSSWVVEPDKKSGDDGSIALWAVRLTDDGPALQPRAYLLDYDEQLHQRIEEANRQMRNGLIQVGTSKRRANDPETPDSSRFADTRQVIEFSDLPDPELPEK